jgi:hypothetical protein
LWSEGSELVRIKAAATKVLVGIEPSLGKIVLEIEGARSGSIGHRPVIVGIKKSRGIGRVPALGGSLQYGAVTKTDDRRTVHLKRTHFR